MKKHVSKLTGFNLNTTQLVTSVSVSLALMGCSQSTSTQDAAFSAPAAFKAKAAGLSDLSLDDSWGLAANVGMDYMINDNWFLNASVWYADIGTTAKYKHTAGATTTQYSTDVDIDPWVFMIGGGYNF